MVEQIDFETLPVKEINYDTSRLITMSNSIISGKQAMTLIEAKLLRIIIMQIAKGDTERMEYTVNISNLSKMLGMQSGNLYRDIQEICYKLSSRNVQIKTGDPKMPWEVFPWLSKAKYDGNGTVHIVLNREIEPYLMQLSELFTQYKITNVLTLTSYYAIRIYEILKMYHNRSGRKQKKFEFTLEELREMTETTDKYKKNSDFKTRVLDYAMREINNKTDIHIDYKLTKTGRKFTGVIFTVKEKKMISVKNDLLELDIDIEDKIQNLFKAVGLKCTKRQAKQLNETYDSDLDSIKKNINLVMEKNRKEPGIIKSPIGYILCLKENKETQNKVKIIDNRRETYIQSDMLDEEWLWQYKENTPSNK